MLRQSLAVVAVIATLLTLVNCSTSGKGRGLEVSYEEFEKILAPTSLVVLEGERQLLLTIALPGDAYPKLYRYDIATNKFTEEYDHGQSIGSIVEDRAGKSLFLHIDNNGDENYQVYLYDVAAKKPTLLFGQAGFQTNFMNSDQAGKTWFFNSNKDNKAIYSIYKMDVATKAVERLTDGKINFGEGIVSADGQKIAAVRVLSNNENKVYVIDTKSKSTKLLFNKPNSVFSPAFFDQNGKHIYGVSDYNRDRTGCAKLPVNSINKVVYVKEAKDKDISCAYGERSDTYLITEEFKGRSQLKIYKKMFTDEIQIPTIFDNQSVSAVSYDRKIKQFLLKFSAANNPGSFYWFDLGTLQTSKVLDYNRSQFSANELATSWDYEFTSFDGMKIHGIVYGKKEWQQSGKKYPLVIWPHGGPDWNERHQYHHWMQYLALNGFVVFAPNYRGSTGYGKKFETLNDKDWGGGHIKDLIAGRAAIEKEPWIDAANVFIFGGSFGGYSTLAAVTFHPDAFKAAVGFVAIGNLDTFMKSIPPDEGWQTEFKREVGDPLKDQALYKERSPFYHVGKVKTPLQIYQAENDVRTVKVEMDDYVAELRKNGKDVEYTVLKDDGHGMSRPESRKQVLEGTVQFFRSYIR